jgi:Flp pilus assembly protein TadB
LVATLIALSLLLGAGAGIGLLFIIAGIRGQPLLSGRGDPTVAQEDDEAAGRRRRAVTGGVNGRTWLMAATLAAVLWLLTGWLAVGVIVLFVTFLFPRLVQGQSARKDWLEKTRAIATWTEMLRDTMAAADGVEEAIAATVPIAPEPIRREVGLLDARRRSEQPLSDALAAFGAEVDHPSADLVVGALSMAALGEGSDFVSVLTRLAVVSRDEMRMRQRIEASRAQLHTASRIIIGVLLFTVGLMFLVARDFLKPYGSAFGQLWLIVIAAIFTIGILLLDRMSQIEMPERFTPRRPRRPGVAV